MNRNVSRRCGWLPRCATGIPTGCPVNDNVEHQCRSLVFWWELQMLKASGSGNMEKSDADTKKQIISRREILASSLGLLALSGVRGQSEATITIPGKRSMILHNDRP